MAFPDKSAGAGINATMAIKLATQLTPSLPAQEEKEEEDVVERVLEHRMVKGVSEYKVKWKGYSLSDCTWQSAEEVPQFSCGPESLVAFEASWSSQSEGGAALVKQIPPGRLTAGTLLVASAVGGNKALTAVS